MRHLMRHLVAMIILCFSVFAAAAVGQESIATQKDVLEKRASLDSEAFLIFPQEAKVDELPPRAANFSLGLTVNEFQNDFGLGIVLTTPYFAKNRFAIRVSANVAFFQGIPENETKADWIPYQAYKFGFIAVGGEATKSNRLYGEGGIVAIMPNKDFSDDKVWGGYGVFGFEFFMQKTQEAVLSYFIELGGIGTNARAEKIAGQPIYSNGFTISTGFRYYF